MDGALNWRCTIQLKSIKTGKIFYNYFLCVNFQKFCCVIFRKLSSNGQMKAYATEIAAP
jgi:hypothetical protein